MKLDDPTRLRHMLDASLKAVFSNSTIHFRLGIVYEKWKKFGVHKRQ